MQKHGAAAKLFISIILAGFIGGQETAHAGTPIVLYQASDSTNNLVPDGSDGTANRPAGEMIGNTIVLGSTNAILTGATIKVGTTNTSNAPQNVTLNIYLNDGPTDAGGSGIQQPGTLIDSVTDSGVSLSSGVVPLNFSFPSLSAPQSFTFIISFSPGSGSSSYVGAMSDNSGPQTGSAANTLWYGNGTAGDWMTNSNWAISDGASKNYLDATFVEAIPEPRNDFGNAAAGLCALLAMQRVRRRIGRRRRCSFPSPLAGGR
jgi:hypothetical protein